MPHQIAKHRRRRLLVTLLIAVAVIGLGVTLASVLPPEPFCTIPLHASFVLDSDLNVIWGEGAVSDFEGHRQSRQGAVEVWDIHSGRLIRSHFGDVGPVQFAFSPKRRFLGVCDRQGNCHLADLKSGREYRALRTGTGDAAILLAFSSDEGLLTVTESNSYQIFDTASGLLRKKGSAPTTVVPAFSQQAGEPDEGLPPGPGFWMQNREPTIISPDGKTRVTWCRKWNAKYGPCVAFEFWDVPTGKQRASGVGAQEDVGRWFFSPDGTLLAVVHQQYQRGIERGFDVWEVNGGRRLWGVKTSICKARQFTPDSRFLIGSDRITASVPPLRLLDARTGEIQLWFPTDGRIQLTPDSRHLLVWEKNEERMRMNRPSQHWLEAILARWWPSSPKTTSKLTVFELWDGREIAQLSDPSCAGARLSDDGSILVMRRSEGTDILKLRLFHVPLRPPLHWIVGGPVAMGVLLVLVYWWRTHRRRDVIPERDS